METQDALYSGEAQLAGWSDSHSGGVKVTLWLPDPSALEPFRSMTVRKGNTAGQLMMVAMVEVNDEGQPVRQPKPPQPLSVAAALMCENPRLWDYYTAEFGLSVTNANEAAEVMRDDLGLLSRADLDKSEAAAQRFHDFRRAFVSWQESQR